MLVSIPSKPAITTKIVIIRNTVSNCPWCAIDQPEQHLVVWQARLHALALAGALFIVVAVFKHGGRRLKLIKNLAQISFPSLRIISTRSKLI